MPPPCLALALLAAFLLPHPGRAADPATPTPPHPMQAIPASDPRFRYEGRLDHTRPDAPVLIWQASRIYLDWEGGDFIELGFGAPQGENFFDATIDGRTTLVSVGAGTPPENLRLTGLGRGRHRLELFKRSEAQAGTVPFTGVRLPAEAAAYAPAPPPAGRPRLLFFGDSITVGACNEDGPDDQWATRRTHNSARSYAALTAAAWGADHRNIAISGMGIVAGYVEIRAGQAWDRLYPAADAPRADLAAWVPDVIFLNYGENDDAFPRSQNRPFPAADFTPGYVALGRAIRAAWPGVPLVLLRGGMAGGHQGAAYRAAWEQAVAELEAGDPAITHFVFAHWSKNHPRVVDHRALADELTAWLRTQPLLPPRH